MTTSQCSSLTYSLGKGEGERERREGGKEREGERKREGGGRERERERGWEGGGHYVLTTTTGEGNDPFTDDSILPLLN